MQNTTWNHPMQDDLQHRTHAINWPDGYTPTQAELFAHNELLVHASPEKVWQLICNATRWPEWYPNARNVVIGDNKTNLEEDGSFTWETFGLPIVSTVSEYVPSERLSWYGGEAGEKPAFYHTWYLIPEGRDACLVITEEVGIGPGAAAFREANEGLLHRGHDLWLAGLKWMAEHDG